MKIWTICGLFFICFSNNSTELDLSTFIDQFKKYDVHQENLLTELMRIRFNQDLNTPAREWLFEVNTQYGLELNGGVQTSSKSASLTRNHRQSGTDVVLQVQENDQVGREERVQTLEVQQSLIQNGFGKQYRKRSEMYEKLNNVIKLQVSETYEDYLAERMNQYLSFVQDYKTLKTNRSLYQLSQKLQEEIDLRKKKNIANLVDVDRVRVQVIERQTAMNLAEKNLKLTVQSLKDSLSEQAFDEIKFIPPEKIPYVDEAVSFDFDQFWKESRTAKLLENQALASDDKILIQKRELYPEAQLVLGLSRDDSRRFSATANREEAIIGLNFSYSFDNSQLKAQLEQAKLEKVQAMYEKKKAKKIIKNQLGGLFEKIQKEKEQLALLERQLTIARRLTKGEKGNFQKGRSVLRDVIDAQNILARAELDLLNQKILLARSIVAWKRVTDSLNKL